MDSLELLYDHYKDTFQLIKENEVTRNKMFIYFIVLLSVLYLLAIEPDSLHSSINSWIDTNIGTSIDFGISIIESFIWIVLLYFTIRYFQIIMYINRQYDYLHTLEGQINQIVDFNFNREGAGYLNEYPVILNIIYYMYTLIFPLMYISIVAYKIINSILSGAGDLSIILNFSIALIIIVLCILFIEYQHSYLKKLFLKFKNIYLRIRDLRDTN